jgi:hypothetical protein
MDALFTPKQGRMAALGRTITGARTPKIRAALVAYEAATAAGADPMPALAQLQKHADDWLRDHADVSDPAERERVEFVDRIRAVASVQWAMAEAKRIYLTDARAAMTAFESDKSKKVQPAYMNLQALGENSGFVEANYAERGGGRIGHLLQDARQKLTDDGISYSPDTAQELAGFQALDQAEFAAVRAYSGSDYSYINPIMGGYGIPDIGQNNAKGQGLDDRQQMNRHRFDEAGMHAGMVAQAFGKLANWQGTTFRGMAASKMLFGLTVGRSAFMAKEYWSTSEVQRVTHRFIKMSNSANPGTNRIAVIMRIKVANGRKISPLSANPGEMEILLPGSSKMTVASRRQLTDPGEIAAEFGAHEPTKFDEYWIVDLDQTFSGPADGVGRYEYAGGDEFAGQAQPAPAAPAASRSARAAGQPLGAQRMPPLPATPRGPGPAAGAQRMPPLPATPSRSMPPLPALPAAAAGARAVPTAGPQRMPFLPSAPAGPRAAAAASGPARTAPIAGGQRMPALPALPGRPGPLAGGQRMPPLPARPRRVG